MSLESSGSDLISQPARFRTLLGNGEPAPEVGTIQSDPSKPPVVARVFEGLLGGRYFLIETIPQFEAFFQLAMQQRVLATDTETSGLNWVHADVCGISVGWGGEWNFYLPINHKTNEKQLNIFDILPQLQILFGDETKVYLLANAKFDLHGLRKLGIEIKGVIHDIVLLAWLLDENMDHGVKEMAVEYLDANADKWEKLIHQWRSDEASRRRHEYTIRLKEQQEALLQDLTFFMSLPPEAKGPSKRGVVTANKLGKDLAKEEAKKSLVDELCARNRKEDVSYDFIPLAYMTPYACSDVHYTWLIFKRLVVQISSHDDLKNLYVSEIALLRVLFETEHAGAKINRQYLNDVEPVLQSEILQLEQEIYNEIGYQFNIDSDDQLTDAMLKAGIKLTKLTKGSKKAIQEGKPDKVAYSVDKEVLAYLAAQYPFADKVLRYRKLQKLKDTYIIGIRDLLDDNDFLHSDYNQNVRTGRMSSREPNLQNIPARDKTIRKAFVTPSDEYVMFFFDYSQIELRLTADRSKDPALLACYPFHGKGEDVHTLTLAEVVLSQPLDQVKAMKSDKTGHVEVFGQCGCPACLYDFYRNVAKRVNFGIIYGVSDKGLVPQVSTPARQVSREECHAYIQAYLKKYEGVKEWIRATEVFMKKHGYVQNSFGRFRRLPNIKSMQKWEMERAARQGVNFLIQGEAADLFKIASVRVFDLLRKLNARSRLVNYVHDELQLYLHKDEMELIKPIKKAMEDFEYSVPIVAEAAYSLTDWGSKKELKE